MADDDALMAVTAEIVGAYVANNKVPLTSVSSLICSISASIRNLGESPTEPAPSLIPAISPRRSVRADHIVCLEDGKKFKSLKRHLATAHGTTPDQYRAKWGLAADYPMVAPEYAATRSAMAKKLGLGRTRKTVTKTVRRPKRARV